MNCLDDPAASAQAEAAALALAGAAMGVASRIAAGATLWAIAPGFDDHARHVAVEFLHPVVVGTRAVPAVALTGTNSVESARLALCAGDVAILLGPATAELAARCRAWGTTTVALVWNTDEVILHADHVVRLGEESDAVRAYHLLWELTQVCLEHSDLLAAQDFGPTCAVCADEAVLGEVSAIYADEEVELRTACGPFRAAALVSNLALGDLVLAHAGTVVGREYVE